MMYLFRGVSAGIVEFTTQADFDTAISSSGSDTSTNVDSLQLAELTIAADPAQETRNVALLVSDDASIDADVKFYLESYFVSTFAYGGDNAVDDVLEFVNVTSISDLAGYDIVIVHPETSTQAKEINQSVIDAFADAGGIVIENMIGYGYQRQKADYTLEENFDYTISAIRDMDYDGSNIWTLDDTSPESVYKLDPADGSVVARYCAPNTVPRSVVEVGGTLYISDSAADKIYAVDPDSLTVHDGSCASPEQGTVYDLGNLSPSPTSPWGLTHVGTYFYLVDSVNDTLYQFTISGASLVQNNAWSLSLTPRAVDVPRGLTSDGTYVYFADQGSNLIYKLSTTDGSVVDAYDPYDGWGQSDVDTIGIAMIDGDLWVTDDEPGTKKLYNNTSYYKDTDNFEYFSKGNTTLETPSFDPTGLTFDGMYFWSADDYSNKLYKLNASTGAVVSSCQTPWSRPSGLAYNSGVLYLSDWNSDKIYLIDPATCNVSSSYSTPSTSPHGLVHDGINLWHVDSDSDTVYKLNPATGAIISSFASPGHVPRGLAWDGTDLWLADAVDDLYYQIDISDGSTINSRSVIDLDAQGITFKNGTLWSTDSHNDRLFDVDSTLLASGQFDSPADNPSGFAYDGTYIWTVDTGTDNIYKINATTGSVITTYASPAADPKGVTWDGSYLWITTDFDNKIYKIDTSDGSTVTSFSAPASDPVGIVYVSPSLYIANPITNKYYEVNPADGSVLNTYDAPGSAAGPMAYDGTHIWNYDTDERKIYKLEFDDDDEGSVLSTSDVYTTSIQGIDFINDVLWVADSYFDKFYNSDSISTEPDAIISVANTYTTPYAVNDQFYYTTRNVDQGFYIQRRLTSVPETASREVLATSSRGGAVFVHEDRTAGDIFAMDLGLLGDNYEISRQTIPAVTFFFDALGINIHRNGNQENTLPTYASISSDLNDLLANCPSAFTRTSLGKSSNGKDIYAYTYGTAGKPMVVYTSGVHGNEEHSYIAEVRWMEDLCTAYNASNDRALNMFNNYEIVFVPLVNTYGIEHLTRYNANGVDINRNYDYHWDTYGSSRKGSTAFSEPESQALRNLITAHQSDIVLVNDAHSAMAISPGMTWGSSFGATPPDIISDIHDVFTGNNSKRWFEEKAGVGRWLTYDRYTYHDDTRPYFGNWLGSLGIASSTNEVMGKKDIDTQRMVHTSSWYKEHFDSTFDALSARYGRSVYRIDASVDSQFSSAVSANTTTPANTSVTFRYATSDTDTEPTTWYDTYSEPTAAQYLFVEVTLQRDSYTDSTPSVQNFSVSYASTATHSGSGPTESNFTDEKNIFNLTATQDNKEVDKRLLDKPLLIKWDTQGVIPFVNITVTTVSGVTNVAHRIQNNEIFEWLPNEVLDTDVLITVTGTDLVNDLDVEQLYIGEEGDIANDNNAENIADVNEHGLEPEKDEAKLVDQRVNMLIKTSASPTVYFTDSQAVRHEFVNEAIYLTWYSGFENIRIISDLEMDMHDVGVPMLPKPDVALVKVMSSPKTYRVKNNPEDKYAPILEWLETEQEASDLYGSNWRNLVIDIDETLFPRFLMGEAVYEDK